MSKKFCTKHNYDYGDHFELGCPICDEIFDEPAMKSETPSYHNIEIPMDIIEAAGKVALYCNDRGYREFTICGLASSSKVKRLTRDLAAATSDLKACRELLEEAGGNDCYQYDKYLNPVPCGKCLSCRCRALLVRLSATVEKEGGDVLQEG